MKWYSSQNWTLTQCELTGQLALVVSGIQRYILFWPQDQQAVLGEALMGKEKERPREGIREKRKVICYIRILNITLGSL